MASRRLVAAALLLAAGSARGDGVIVGLNVGTCVIDGAPGQTFDGGLGTALVVGYRTGALSFELNLIEGYDLAPKADAFDGDATRGRLGVMSLGVRWAIVPYAGVYAGVARVTVPLVSRTTDSDTEEEIGRVRTETSAGIGGAAGAFLALPLAPTIDLLVEGRGYLLYYESPGSPYVSKATMSPDGKTAVVEYTTERVQTRPITLSAGLRFVL